MTQLWFGWSLSINLYSFPVSSQLYQAMALAHAQLLINHEDLDASNRIKSVYHQRVLPTFLRFSMIEWPREDTNTTNFCHPPFFIASLFDPFERGGWRKPMLIATGVILLLDKTNGAYLIPLHPIWWPFEAVRSTHPYWRCWLLESNIMGAT